MPSGIHFLSLGCISVKLAAIQSMVWGEDVYVSVPTGFGKSLMYQILMCAQILLAFCGSTDLVTLVVIVCLH